MLFEFTKSCENGRRKEREGNVKAHKEEEEEGRLDEFRLETANKPYSCGIDFMRIFIT